MFQWLKRLFAGATSENGSTAERQPFPRGGPIQYQPPILAARRYGTAALGETHEALLYDSLRAAGRMRYAYLW